MTLSELCVECGLCCEGSLFRFVPVEAEEVSLHRRLSLPVVTQSGRLAMALPCARLEGRRCTVYGERPRGCRAFVCHLGHRLAAGAVAPAEALLVVREAQARIARLAAAFPAPGAVVQAATARALEGGLHGDALAALEAVQAWLDDTLHWPDT